MMGIWKETKLKDIADDLVMGQAPDSSSYNTDGIGLPFIQGNADIDGKYPKIRFYTSDPKKISLKNDILLTVRAPVGDFYVNNIEKIAIGRGISAIRINDISLSQYVYYYLNWDVNQFIRLQQGTTFTEIGKKEVRNLKIQIPTLLSEQKAIAGILSKVDESIEAVESSIKAAERLKKSLMQNLLTGKLKPDGTWRTEDEFEQTRIGLLPKNWRLVKAKDICEKVTDGTHDTPSPSSTGFPLVTSKNLKNGSVDFEGCYLISENDFVEINKRSKVDQVDIIFGMIGTVGNPQIVTQEPVEFAIKNVGLFKLNGDKQMSYWIKNYLSSSMFEMYKFKQQAGTTQQFVSLGFLRKIPIPIPFKDGKVDYGNIIQINSKLEKVIDILSMKQGKLQSLKTLKKSLMQNLLTGKVRVDVEKINQMLEDVN